MMQIESQAPKVRFPVLNLGFRPFFALAAIWAVVAVGLWLGFFVLGWPFPASGLSPIAWHAHEMVFGYALAVIAGFLLTAVRNWTQVQTPWGLPLLGLALLWLVARAGVLGWGLLPPWLGMGAEALFIALLVLAVAWPVIRVRQWGQLPIVLKLLLFLPASLAWYAGLLGWLEDGERIGLYSGFYLVLALIFNMGRRVIPFFIERGVDDPDAALKNCTLVDRSNLLLFLAMAVIDVFVGWPWMVGLLAAVLAVLNAVRLWGWHHPDLWRKPLLWVLYLGYAWLVVGFVLLALGRFGLISPLLAVHAFAYGGIGMMTLGMMARVSLGHTGRNVFQPPAMLTPVFGLLMLGAVVRVFLPMVAPDGYRLWIALSQILWMLAFAGFAWRYLPMLWQARVDGRWG